GGEEEKGGEGEGGGGWPGGGCLGEVAAPPQYFDTSPFGPDVGLARHRRDQPPHLVSSQSRGAISHGRPPCPRLLRGGKNGEKHPLLWRSDQKNWEKTRPCHQNDHRRKRGRTT